MLTWVLHASLCVAEDTLKSCMVLVEAVMAISALGFAKDESCLMPWFGSNCASGAVWSVLYQ